MNPLLNPLFSLKILQHYLTDVNRAWKLSETELKNFQDKSLKKILRYASTVPLYQKKYGSVDMQPENIGGVDDLHRLPLTTKYELIDYFPDGIIPHSFNKKNAVIVGTSGSSGRPMSMFKDAEYIFIEALAGYRQLKAYNMHWRKTRITNIGDFSVPTTTDEESLNKVLLGNLKTFFSLKNYQNLYTGEEPRILLNKIEEFKPELIIGYTSLLMGLATLKRKGFGDKVTPRYIISSGEVLDSYSRTYISDAFDVPVFNLYATTEGGVIAFECLNGNFHINNDFVAVEILDKHGDVLPYGEFGSVVITRLYRGGTPIIRYTGLNDIASLEENTCDCGMHTPLLKTLEGRKKDAIIFPDGRIFPPATIPMPLADAAAKYNTLQIERFQFIQQAIDKIDLNIKIDEKQRDVGIPVTKLLDEIKENYQKLAGPTVAFTVNEVTSVKKEKDGSIPLIISKIDVKKIENMLL